MGNITSKPLSSAPARSASGAALALAGLAIGGVLWLIGARYTIDGLPVLANLILSFFRVPYQFPTLVYWPVYLVLAPLPYLASRVEWTPPISRKDGHWQFAPAEACAIWCVVAGLDAFTTYLGLTSPAPDASALAVEIAQSLVVSGILAVLLTFGPEWLFRWCWRKLRR